MMKEFKEFAMRGNVVDMAVGIIIGGAFGTIVKSLVNDVLMPPIGLLLGGVDFTNFFAVLKEGATGGPYNALADAQAAGAVTAFSVGYPFVKTGMTEAYADNPKVFGRWQPRMLEPWEASSSLAALLCRSNEELAGKFFQVNVHGEQGDSEVAVTWSEIAMRHEEQTLSWSTDAPLKFS